MEICVQVGGERQFVVEKSRSTGCSCCPFARIQGDEATCIWILHEGSVEHLKGGKVVGTEVWAPGVLGVVALRGLRQRDGDWAQKEEAAEEDRDNFHGGIVQQRPEWVDAKLRGEAM